MLEMVSFEKHILPPQMRVYFESIFFKIHQGLKVEYVPGKC